MGFLLTLHDLLKNISFVSQEQGARTSYGLDSSSSGEGGGVCVHVCVRGHEF